MAASPHNTPRPQLRGASEWPQYLEENYVRGGYQTLNERPVELRHAFEDEFAHLA